MIKKNCTNCDYHLGSGYCRLNSEKECAENEFELWKISINDVEIKKKEVTT